MLGSHLVLVMLHGRFVISIWARQIELVTLNTIFSGVSYGILCHCVNFPNDTLYM